MSTRNTPKTLLPPNAQTAESALATAAARLSDIAVPLHTLWDPATCPASYLPWLAWALSVDSWDSTWPESLKRQVLAKSIAIHQRKGTIGAVRRAMEALGVKIELKEWWETSPQGTPHTFSLTAYANANLAHDGESVLNDRVYRALKQVVDSTKPVRSHYQMTIAAQFGQGLTLQDAMSGASVSRQPMAPPPVEPEFATGLTTALGATGVNLSRQDGGLKAPPTPGLETGLGVAAGANSLGLARQTADMKAPQKRLNGTLWAVSGAKGVAMARPAMVAFPPLQQIQASRLFTKAAAQGLSVVRLSMELRA